MSFGRGVGGAFLSDISDSIGKVDNKSKISGTEQYINDIPIDNLYYAGTYRSTVVKARIKKVLYPQLPKDCFIVDKDDIPGENVVNIVFEDYPVFAKESVTYYGEPICLVISKDKSLMQKILKNIKVIYEEEEATFDFKDSVVHYDIQKGNERFQVGNGIHFVEQVYETGYQEHVYIEPQGMTGQLKEGKILLTGSIQCPYYAKNAVHRVLGRQDGVRVIQSTTGGAFGGKEEFPSLLACQLAVAVNKLKVPISLIYERSEDIQFTSKRHPSKIKLQAYVTDAGDIKQVNVKIGIDGGAYIGLSSVVLQRAMLASSGVYAFDNMMISGDVYRTNTVPTGAFRGFGAPQMFFAIEMFIQHIAKVIGKDPLEIRKRHLVKQGDTTSSGGKFRDLIMMPQMIDKIMEKSSYLEKTKKYKTYLEPKGDVIGYKKEDVYKGIGMSWFLHGCGFTGSGEQKHIKAVVRLKKMKNDKVKILVASVDMGQGIKTTMRKLVANELEISIEDVLLHNPDTDKVPDSGPTVASRTMMIVGGLLLEAAKELKEKWEDGIEQFVEKQYKQPEFIKWNEEKLEGDAYPAYSWGIHVVEVEVSKVTYQTKIKGIWTIYDIGKAIDERIIIGQAEGGVLQGIGYGLLEVMDHDKGRIRQKNITDYIIPTAKDTVFAKTYFMNQPFAYGPYGAKGAGELTLIGGAPAVALAVENAIGKKVTKIPVTPEYIMELVENE